MNLNLIDYNIARALYSADLPFSALIAAAGLRADTANTHKLQGMFPELLVDLQKRYDAPGGLIEGDNTSGGELDRDVIKQAGVVAACYLKKIKHGD